MPVPIGHAGFRKRPGAEAAECLPGWTCWRVRGELKGPPLSELRALLDRSRASSWPLWGRRRCRRSDRDDAGLCYSRRLRLTGGVKSGTGRAP